MANEPNHGIVVPFARKNPQRITIRQAPEPSDVNISPRTRSVAAMAAGMQAVFEASPQAANTDTLGDLAHNYQTLSLHEFSKHEVLNKELFLEGQKFVSDTYRDVLEHYAEHPGNARQQYGSFTNFAHGLLYGLECYVQTMAAGGCSELVPLLAAVMQAKDKASDASFALNGGM